MIVSLDAATPLEAGGKAAVLGALARAGFPVPPGFVVPAGVYRAVTSGLSLPAVLAERGPEDVRRLIEAAAFPSELIAELTDALRRLGDDAVAVRSSGSSEDGAVASAAGQHDSFLGVRGQAAVAQRLVATWASLWSDRAVAYRGAGEAEMGVVVQRQIDAEVAGVLFTGSTTVIEASWGLGESVVRGVVTPDAYTVTAAGVVDRRMGDKQTRIDRGENGTITTQVPPEAAGRLCLDDQQLVRLAQLGQDVAEHLGAPQDIEFALKNNEIWLLQARPITAPISQTPAGRSAAGGDLHGTGGSSGRVSGTARVVHGPEDFRRVRRGDILVCRFTDPAWTPLFGVVAGVVTETGGRLSHAAIVAREHRIPAVLGVPGAMTTLHDGQQLTLDGAAGTIHRR
ncbi:PEP/pyruvate-binding domain-containing protein [Kribbella sp. NPDC023972]|uniref:PEP/pyruvate-binding domain-containing protein n=1 Tax=Kribbella sp. NPDC023972 TaxID=3154795 RepID=UPI0033ED7DAA